jgi:hypothetical protein
MAWAQRGSWDQIAAALAPESRVLRLDLRGHCCAEMATDEETGCACTSVWAAFRSRGRRGEVTAAHKPAIPDHAQCRELARDPRGAVERQH